MIQEIFIKHSGSIHDLAKDLRETFNMPETNKNRYKSQHGESVNMGGEYYRFETLGLIIMLSVNSGENLVEDYAGYQYFLEVAIEAETDQSFYEALYNHFFRLLSKSGYEVAVDQ